MVLSIQNRILFKNRGEYGSFVLPVGSRNLPITTLEVNIYWQSAVPISSKYQYHSQWGVIFWNVQVVKHARVD